MEEKNEDKIKILLSDVDKEFYELTPRQQAKFAMEQMSTWQQRFNEAKSKVLKENFVDATRERKTVKQSSEVEA